ncbi:MAG: nucleoside hydrolase [Lachnospiraceae bacterium]|nr:nucleoside hydrolase [Lachnospiraceae bacterium]
MWKYEYTVPENKKIRLIVHTDCKNEADDQFALAHHLMTPRFDVKGIVAGHFCKNPQDYGKEETAKASYDEVLKILKLMELEGRYPVWTGAEAGMEDEQTPMDSDGARFIIEEAMKEDTRPLYIACQGALTDVASALLIRPEIAEKMTVIWIGGGDYPKGGFEFNLVMDIHAANVVFCSKVPLWQIPISLYKNLAVSLAELQLKVRPCGKIGEYLFRQMVMYNEKASGLGWVWPHGEIWGLGDQGTIAVLMEELEKVSYDLIAAPRILEDMTYLHGQDNREIRVYQSLDVRLTLEDFFAKLAINFGNNNRPGF